MSDGDGGASDYFDEEVRHMSTLRPRYRYTLEFSNGRTSIDAGKTLAEAKARGREETGSGILGPWEPWDGVQRRRILISSTHPGAFYSPLAWIVRCVDTPRERA